MNRPNERLRHARQLRGLSQAEVAEKIGASAHTISRWERGDVFPNPYYRRKLSMLFEVSVAELGFLVTENKEEQIALIQSSNMDRDISSIESPVIKVFDEINLPALAEQSSLSIEQPEHINDSFLIWRMRWFLVISVTTSSLMTLVVVGVVFYLTRNLYTLSILIVLSPLLYILSHMTRYYFPVASKKEAAPVRDF